MGRPVTHFEIGTRDLGKATQFYGDLFGWEIEAELTPGYRLIPTADGSVGGGLLNVPEGVEPYVTVYVGVENLRATLEKAQALGAKVLVEPTPVSGVGAFAVFTDPDGAMIGILEERQTS